MSTSNYDPGYPFTNVELKTTEGAQIESPIRVFTMYFWEFELSRQFTVLSWFEYFEIFGRHTQFCFF